MAKQIIDARVRQKVGTEAEWLANDLKLLDGEAAIVRTGDGTPVNLKFGDGNKKFSELPYFIDFNNSQRISSVPPGALPTPTEENVYMEVTAVGTWTYGGNPVGSNADGYQTTFWWNGTTWVNNGSVRVKGEQGASASEEFFNDIIEQYNLGVFTPTYTWDEYADLTNRVRFNSNMISDKDGFVTSLYINARRAGQVSVEIGHIVDESGVKWYSKDGDVGIFTVSVGDNTIDLSSLDIPIETGQAPVVRNGTAIISYDTLSAHSDDFRVIAGVSSDIEYIEKPLGDVYSFGYTLETRDNVLKDELDSRYINKYNLEENVVDKLNNPVKDSVILGVYFPGTAPYGSQFTDRVVFNSNMIAQKDGFLTNITVGVGTAGNMTFQIGEVRYDNIYPYFKARKTVGTFPVSLGRNDIVINEDIKKGETIALVGGSTGYLYYGNRNEFPNDRLCHFGNSKATDAGYGTYKLMVSFSCEIIYPIEDSLVSTVNKIVNYSENSKKITVINVDTSQGINAIQNAINSITDANENNIYNIIVDNGVYKATLPEHFIGNNTGSPAFICMKDYVNVIGKSASSVIIWAELPYSATYDAMRGNYQTVWNYSDNATLENVTLVAKGIRYTLHQDSSQEAFKQRKYKNVHFKFYGDKGFRTALGTGTYSGSVTHVIGGSSESPTRHAFSTHNNRGFSFPSLWSFKNHSFTNVDSTDTTVIINVINSGSMQDCQIEMVGCTFNGAYTWKYYESWIYRITTNDHFNHANYRIIGHDNTPIFFSNEVIGTSLMVKSASKNVNVRFDKSSSAYNALISNPYKYYGDLCHPDRRIFDEYVIQDGSIDTEGIAFGAKSLYQGYYANSGYLSEDSMGQRLGDCSTTNKTLGIIINGTTYTVTFNKNYTAMTNPVILAEINAALGSAGTASLISYGQAYYAEFTDVLNYCTNQSTTTKIPKGTLVTIKNGRISPCGENDILFGLAIDEIAPYYKTSEGEIFGRGRVIRNCYVTTEANKVQTVLVSGTGTRYKVSGGQFVADVNGKYDIVDSKYILI